MSFKSILTSSLAAVLVLAQLSSCSLALNGEWGLIKRQDIVQGWALAEPICPQGTATCGAAACCPIGSYCDTSDSDSNFCCPTDQPCGYNVTHGTSSCADPSWVKFITTKDPICCMPGNVGLQPTGGQAYGTCVPSASSVLPGQLATPVSATTTAAATSMATTTASGSSGSKAATTAAASASTTKASSGSSSGSGSSTTSSAASSHSSNGAAPNDLGSGSAVKMIVLAAGGVAAYMAV